MINPLAFLPYLFWEQVFIRTETPAITHIYLYIVNSYLTTGEKRRERIPCPKGHSDILQSINNDQGCWDPQAIKNSLLITSRLWTREFLFYKVDLTVKLLRVPTKLM